MTYEEMLAKSTPRPWNEHPYAPFEGTITDIDGGADNGGWSAKSIAFGYGEIIVGYLEFRTPHECSGYPFPATMEEVQANFVLTTKAVNAYKPLIDALETALRCDHGAIPGRICDSCRREGLTALALAKGNE